MTDTVAVVLAGGEGRRMGAPKPSQLLAGRTLLDRALERARRFAPQVAVAVRDPGQASDAATDARLLTDDPAIPGPLAGIASALDFAAACDARFALTLPVDSPFAPDDLLERLAAVMTPRTGCVMAASGGRLHPVCALWRAGAGETLRTYAASSRGALMGLADAVGWAAVEWPSEPVDPFMNINSPEELARAEAILAG